MNFCNFASSWDLAKRFGPDEVQVIPDGPVKAFCVASGRFREKLRKRSSETTIVRIDLRSAITFLVAGFRIQNLARAHAVTGQSVSEVDEI